MLVFSALHSSRGAVAQLGERLNGIQEVVGSIPIGSTIKSSLARDANSPATEIVRACPCSLTK